LLIRSTVKLLTLCYHATPVLVELSFLSAKRGTVGVPAVACSFPMGAPKKEAASILIFSAKLDAKIKTVLRRLSFDSSVYVHAKSFLISPDFFSATNY